MNTKINLQTILIVFMVCITVVASTNTYVKAQEGGTAGATKYAPESEIMVDPVPGGPGFIMVSPFDFKPFNTSYPQAYAGSFLYNPSTTLQTDSVAGLTLPHGATITKVTLYYYDDVSSNVTLVLIRAGAEGWDKTLAIFSSDGAQPGYRSVSQTNIVSSKVDNQNFSYFLELAIPPNGSLNLSVSNVRIDYEYTVYTPAIMK